MSWTDKNFKWILAAVFVVTFFYLWLVVQPPLIFQHQQSEFFTSTEFFKQHLSYPGGIADYLSGFATQFYPVSILGVLIITLVIAAIALAALKVFREFKLGSAASFLTTLLIALLLSVHSNYFYPLSFSLALLLTLAAFLLLLKLARHRFILRIILFSLLARFLYFTVAAPFLLFVALVLFYQLLLASDNAVKKAIAGTIFLLTAVFWPILTHSTFLLFNSKDVFTYLLPIQLVYSFQFKLQLLYLLLLIAPLVGGLIHSLRRERTSSGTINTHQAYSVAAFAVYVIALCIMVGTSFNAKHKLVIQIDKLAQEHAWQDVVTTAEKHTDVLHRLITLQYNRALYHTGRLLDDLFNYPHIEGEKGLYRNSGPAFESPYVMACIMFEMGNPNSAQTWANEALSIEGQSARILKLLTLIHLQKGEVDAAAIYLNNVKQTIGNKEWTTHYEQLVAEPYRIQSDPMFSTVQSAKVLDNFLFRFGNAYGELKFLHEKSTPSQMAFEYLMAYNLLSRDLQRVAELAPCLLTLSYSYIPRHIEEALILIAMSGVTTDVDLNAFEVSARLIDDFKEFMAIIAKHNNNTQYAQAELLTSFGETYWYYHIYHQSREL